VHLLDGRLLTTVAGSSYGHALLARLGLFAATMAWLAVFRRGSRVLAAFTGAPLALALLATLPLAGHPDAGSHRALALLVDTVHVAAMSTWVGGLAVLAGLLVRTHRDVDLPPVVARFSRQAAISLLVLVGSGIVAAVREVGSPSALYSTDYGIILFLKINLVIVVVGVAAVSRGWIRRRTRRKIGAAELTLLGTGKPQDWSSPGTGITHVPVERRELVLAGGPVLSMAAVSSPRVRSSASPSDSPTLRRRQAELEALRHSVVAELVIALVILGVTAVLVATVPAKTAYRPTTSTTVSTGPMVLRVSALPAGPRQVTLHVTARDRSGIAIPDAAVNAALLLPQEGFSLLPLRLEDLGQGRFLAEDVRVPVAGQWHLRLAVRTSDLQVYQAETPLQIH
jgi:copper transport protein